MRFPSHIPWTWKSITLCFFFAGFATASDYSSEMEILQDQIFFEEEVPFKDNPDLRKTELFDGFMVKPGTIKGQTAYEVSSLEGAEAFKIYVLPIPGKDGITTSWNTAFKTCANHDRDISWRLPYASDQPYLTSFGRPMVKDGFQLVNNWLAIARPDTRALVDYNVMWTESWRDGGNAAFEDTSTVTVIKTIESTREEVAYPHDLNKDGVEVLKKLIKKTEQKELKVNLEQSLESHKKGIRIYCVVGRLPR